MRRDAAKRRSVLAHQEGLSATGLAITEGVVAGQM
jgi:hypothetical protein